MSLIITRNFKRAKAQDAAAQDIKLPFIITFNNGKKEFREGYSAEEVRRRFDKSVAALYGGIKSVKLEGEDKRDGKDSFAADAKFKKGDRVAYSVFGQTKTGTVVEVAEKFHSEYGNEHEGEQTYMVDFGKKPYTKTWESRMTLANSRAADACGTDAKLQKGDKVRVWQYPVYGKMGEVVEATNGSMEYTVNVEGKDYPRIDYRRIVKMSDAAGDAAELRVVHAKGIGKWWVEPNLSRFNDADREQTHKGRKEFPDREAAIKYARGTGKTFIVNDACDKRSR